MVSAATPAERREVVSDLRRVFGFSEAKAYRLLKEGGWESGRSKRKDAGSTSARDTLLLSLAEMQKKCVRENGVATLPLNVARSILKSRGVDIPVLDGRLRALLKERHMSVKDAKAPAPHQSMRSMYPNQVHEADPSVALLYYAPCGGQKIIRDSEHYKNKNFFEGGKEKCLRYVLTDHYSGSICARWINRLRGLSSQFARSANCIQN